MKGRTERKGIKNKGMEVVVERGREEVRAQWTEERCG